MYSSECIHVRTEIHSDYKHKWIWRTKHENLWIFTCNSLSVFIWQMSVFKVKVNIQETLERLSKFICSTTLVYIHFQSSECIRLMIWITHKMKFYSVYSLNIMNIHSLAPTCPTDIDNLIEQMPRTKKSIKYRTSLRNIHIPNEMIHINSRCLTLPYSPSLSLSLLLFLSLSLSVLLSRKHFP